MMKKSMSYIFLDRDEKKQLPKDKNGNYVISLSDTIYGKLKTKYTIKESGVKEVESVMNGKQCGTIEIDYKDKIKYVDFELTSATGTYYLNIISNERSILDNISILEEINDDIIGNNMFDKNYITIVSYDSISQYYCDRIYPILNSFERKFRKLLLITYTSNFKKAYFEITVPEEIRKKAKQNIKNKSDDERLKNYLYSLEFGMLRSLLFDKNWNDYDEKKLNLLLKENSDLSKLSDEQLRNIINDNKPKSDWERLFSNKGFDNKIEETIGIINDFRNRVAHSKFFYKNDFLLLSDVLKKTNNTIDSAIKYTESEEFLKMNEDEMKRKLGQIANIISSWTKSYTEALDFGWIKVFTEQTKAFSDVLKKSLEQCCSWTDIFKNN